MSKPKRNRVNVWLSLSDEELATLEAEMQKNGFREKATFIKWIYLRHIRDVQTSGVQ